MVEKLRSAGRLVTEENLGFSVKEIETHSIRSGAAMYLFLGGVQTFSIIMIGRWSFDAFLRYIRKQVEQLTHNSSKRMLEFEIFLQLRTLSQWLQVLIQEQEMIGTILQRLDIMEYRMQIRDNRSR